MSAIQWGTGYILALVAGLVLGMVIGRIRTMKIVLKPFVMALYSTPMVVLLALFIIWLRSGHCVEDHGYLLCRFCARGR